jgi:hypothetical protein
MGDKTAQSALKPASDTSFVLALMATSLALAISITVWVLPSLGGVH